MGIVASTTRERCAHRDRKSRPLLDARPASNVRQTPPRSLGDHRSETTVPFVDWLQAIVRRHHRSVPAPAKLFRDRQAARESRRVSIRPPHSRMAADPATTPTTRLPASTDRPVHERLPVNRATPDRWPANAPVPCSRSIRQRLLHPARSAASLKLTLKSASFGMHSADNSTLAGLTSR